MKTISIITVALIFLHISQTFSQCESDHILINSNEDLLEFINNYNSCDTIEANITIKNINDLSGLNFLKKVDGMIWLDSIESSSINGLDSLSHSREIYLTDILCDSLNIFKSISNTQKIIIQDSDSIKYMNTLPHLTEIEYLEIWESSFSELSFLPNLQIISKRLIIGNNNYIQNLTVLENLRNPTGGIWIGGLNKIEEIIISDSIVFATQLLFGSMDKLQSINGGQSLKRVHDLEISSFDNPFSTEGLNNIEIIDNSIFMNFNNIEIPQNFLPNLTHVEDIFISENTNLTNLEFLSNATFTGKNLLVNLNPQLENCNIELICNAIEDSSELISFSVSMNATGCFSEEEVQSQCMSNTNSYHKNPLFYPNPVSEILKINQQSLDLNNQEIQLFDTNMNLIRNQNLNFNEQINVQDLPQGIYYLKTKKSIHRIIKS